MKSPVTRRAVTLNGRKTSVSVEQPFWLELKSIAAERKVGLHLLISMVDTNRQHGSLSSALRLFVLAKYRPETIDSRSHPCETDREFTENERPAGRLLCDP
jgi:predicted DNA-binding ribbon-helix-helix protein